MQFGERSYNWSGFKVSLNGFSLSSRCLFWQNGFRGRWAVSERTVRKLPVCASIIVFALICD